MPLRAYIEDKEIVSIDLNDEEWSALKARLKAKEIVVILFVAGMLLYAAGYYTAHGMWWTVAALLSLTAVACIVITHHEWGRIRDLQRRIRELREFDEA